MNATTLSPLGSFVVASSAPVILPFFYRVGRIPDTIKNYSYHQYTLINPLYFGLVNLLSSQIFRSTSHTRFILTGLVSGIFVCTFSTLTQAYNFTQREWFLYYIRIILTHVFTFLIIGFLEKNTQN